MFLKLYQEAAPTNLPTQLPKGPDEIATREGPKNRGNPSGTPVTGTSATRWEDMLSDAVASALTSAILRN